MHKKHLHHTDIETSLIRSNTCAALEAILKAQTMIRT